MMEVLKHEHEQQKKMEYSKYAKASIVIFEISDKVFYLCLI